MPESFVSSGPGSSNAGTVTSVAGTANQIDVASGTSAAVVSQNPVALAGQAPYGGTTAGTATVQTLTVPNLPAAIATGIKISFTSGFASTGATMLTVTPTGGSAYAAINLMKRGVSGPQALSASGDLISGNIYVAMYDGTQWVLEGTSSEVYTAGTLSTGALIRGNAQNQLTGSTGIISSNGTALTTYNSEAALPSPGIPYLKGVTSQKAESAADTNVLTVTPAAAAGVYRINIVIDVSAATAATLGWTATWTDSNGNAQAPTNLEFTKAGVAAPVLTIVATAGDTYAGSWVISVNSAATAIVVKLTFTGTSFAARMSAILERLA